MRWVMICNKRRGYLKILVQVLKALDKKDLQGIQVVHKFLESSRKKVDSLTKNHEELSRKQDKLGENQINNIDNLFANIKKTKK